MTKLAKNLIIDAKAGTGKTTTLAEGVSYMIEGKNHEPDFEPSEQQKAIWKKMRVGKKPRSILMCAFNKSIAEELAKRVPIECETSTLHSIGYRALLAHTRQRRMRISKWRSIDLLEDYLQMDSNEIRKKYKDDVNAYQKLMSLCKLRLVGMNTEDIDEEVQAIVDFYDVEVNDYTTVLQWLTECLEKARDVDDTIDYDDMIWLPVVLGIQLVQRDLVLVDEAQDLNPVQQEFVMRLGDRIILCGDPKQAIYGFAAADTNSIETMTKRLLNTPRGIDVLPLYTTFRCGKRIVQEAQAIVPQFKAHESNPNGEVHHIGKEQTMEILQDGNMIVCRINAPLISTAFRLLADGRKACIIGREIGQGLIRLIKKLKASTVSDLIDKIEEYTKGEIKKLMRTKRPDDDRIILLNDKKECILAFCEGCTSITEITRKIEVIFQDNTTSGIRLSSIHRAKGLEADKVFILRPELIPHPMAKTKEARTQEMNLKYVAITRAIHSLYYVAG